VLEAGRHGEEEERIGGPGSLLIVDPAGAQQGQGILDEIERRRPSEAGAERDARVLGEQVEDGDEEVGQLLS
jgi:hypothetical protein